MHHIYIHVFILKCRLLFDCAKWGHTLVTQRTSKMGIKGGNGGLTLGCIIGGGGGGVIGQHYIIQFFLSFRYE